MVLEKIRWTDRVQNAVSQEVEEERNILHTIKRRKYIALYRELPLEEAVDLS
jgi:hypothetical protein